MLLSFDFMSPLSLLTVFLPFQCSFSCHVCTLLVLFRTKMRSWAHTIDARHAPRTAQGDCSEHRYVSCGRRAGVLWTMLANTSQSVSNCLSAENGAGVLLRAPGRFSWWEGRVAVDHVGAETTVGEHGGLLFLLLRQTRRTTVSLPRRRPRRPGLCMR